MSKIKTSPLPLVMDRVRGVTNLIVGHTARAIDDPETGITNLRLARAHAEALLVDLDAIEALLGGAR